MKKSRRSGWVPEASGRKPRCQWPAPPTGRRRAPRGFRIPAFLRKQTKRPRKGRDKIGFVTPVIKNKLINRPILIHHGEYILASGFSLTVTGRSWESCTFTGEVQCAVGRGRRPLHCEPVPSAGACRRKSERARGRESEMKHGAPERTARMVAYGCG
jgi:hypothetical protein